MFVAGLLTSRFVTDGAADVGPVGPDGSWSLAWGDEFDGGLLEPGKWQPNRYGSAAGDAPFNPDDEAAWFSPESVRVRDGLLSVTVEAEEATLAGRTYPYRSGVVQAVQPEYAVTAGTYVEARVRVPQCDGCWPAFWLVPADRWPPEIDIFEYFGSESDRRPMFNYHAEDDGEDDAGWGPASYGEYDSDYREDFHVYGLLWQDGRAIPYLDGTAYPEVAAHEVTSLPMMLILNLSVQEGHRPAVGSTLLVDWVRVWRPTADTSGG